MRSKALSRATLFVAFFVFCSCVGGRRQEAERASASHSNQETELDSLTGGLRRLYEQARSESDRRAICLRAIDEGAVRQGGSITSIDAIFGTQFAADIPTEIQGHRKARILFADQPSHAPPDSGRAFGFVGWYMSLEYDFKGTIQGYHLSNIHKGISSNELKKETSSVEELKRLYEAAKSEHEKRAVCLKAIDEGVIHTSGTVSIIDQVFITHFASDLPGNKNKKRQAVVWFTSRAAPSPSQATAATVDNSTGWFMVVDYFYDGTIDNYYLTNMHK